MPLFKPFLSYNNEAATLYPNEAREDYAEPHDQQANDTFGGGTRGTMTRYVFGTQDYIHVRFQYQSEALKTQWEAFRVDVEPGQVFVYHDDDSYTLSGSGAICGDGTICGALTSAGATDRKIMVTLVSMSIDQSDMEGFWDVTLDLRRAA